jgi:hypothetical protein
MESNDDARRDLLRRIQHLDERHVLLLGHLRADIVHAWSDDAEHNSEVVLTGRQRAHYLARHPETATLEVRLTDALLDPNEVHRNRYDPAIAIFYRQIDSAHYVRVAVLMQRTAGALKHSVLSYRLANTREVVRNRARAVWGPR